MENFKYYNPTKLVFGKGTVVEIIGEIPENANKILLHYGKSSIKKSGLYDDIVGTLQEYNYKVVELSGVVPNPKLDLVRDGIELCRKENVDFILAVGGGSVIDSAKAIAAGTKFMGDVWELFTENIELKEALPLGVILTIPATGSESSSATIISNQETNEKLNFENDLLRPKFAILNPEFTLTLPKNHTFAGIVDILSHVMERYFTNTKAVELTDHLCEATMKTVLSNAIKLLENPNDYNARAEIMLAGTISHSDILGIGRAEDWASHRIGHQITALYGTTHGVTMSIILPAWMKYVYKENMEIFERFAEQVFNVNDSGLTSEEKALKGIEKFEEFLEKINMPISFTQADFPIINFESIAGKCTHRGMIGNLKRLSKNDVNIILDLAK